MKSKQKIHVFFLFWASICLLPNSVFAVCPSDGEVARRAADAIANRPIAGYAPDITLGDAYCAQAKYVNALQEQWGSPIGYKVGFTGKKLQAKFGVSEPAIGVLLQKMIVPDGGKLDPDFGFRGFVEPDMVVTVKDHGIAEAKTLVEVLAHISEVRPFLELPALQFSNKVTLTGVQLVAANIAARAGVYGKGLPVKATLEFVEAFAQVQTILTDETGQVLQTAPGSNLMGNPLKVILWLNRELKKRGTTLQAGQIISLGGFGRLFPIRVSGKTYTLTYKGFPGGDLSTSIHIN